MAILNSLIVNGSSRFLNKIYAKDIQIDGAMTISGDAVFNGHVSAGYANSASKISTNGVISNDWFRSVGNCGWYSQNYGGGIYMTDSSYIRTFGSKPFYIQSGALFVNNTNNYWDTAGNIVNTGAVKTPTLNASNIHVTDTIHATHFDLQSITQIGNDSTLYVAPSIKLTGSSKLVVTNSSTSSTMTVVVQDSGISTSSMAGFVWGVNAKVKAGGTIGGVATGTMEGTITALSSGSMTLSLTNTEASKSVSSGTYTAGTTTNDFTVMMYQNASGYRTGIVLTSYGYLADYNGNFTKSTYLDMYAGTSSAPHIRIGKLDGLPSVTYDSSHVYAPSGWGMYAENVYLKGNIFASAGIIGGFITDSTSIHTSGKTITDNSSNNVGLSSTDFTRTVAGSSRSGLRLAIGSNFGVSNSGVIYASNVVMSGIVTATSGKIGNWLIGSNALYNGTTGLSSTVAGTYMGTDGYLNYKDANTYVKITNGTLISNAASITGNITATSGKIGIFNIDNALYTSSNAFGTTDNNIYVGPSGISLGTSFKVTNTGELTSSSGKIAGWTIQGGQFYIKNQQGNEVFLRNGDIGMQDVLVVKSGDNYPFWIRADGSMLATKGTIGGWTITETKMFRNYTNNGYSCSMNLDSGKIVFSGTKTETINGQNTKRNYSINMDEMGLHFVGSNTAVYNGQDGETESVYGKFNYDTRYDTSFTFQTWYQEPGGDTHQSLMDADRISTTGNVQANTFNSIKLKDLIKTKYLTASNKKFVKNGSSNNTISVPAMSGYNIMGVYAATIDSDKVYPFNSYYDGTDKVFHVLGHNISGTDVTTAIHGIAFYIANV